MMNKLKYLSVAALSTLLSACGSDPLSPGVEYMPDMYRGPAVEAYVDYNDIDSTKVRHHVEGTIAYNTDIMNSSPFAYPNTFEGYEDAGRYLTNPIAYSESVLNQGKVVYENFCIHCHGATGEGDGSVVKVLIEKRDNYSLKPPSYSKQLKDLPDGKIFFSIHYGKNNMGSHASQISKEDRWKLVHYVRYLMNGGSNPQPSIKTDSTNVTAQITK
jgi:mono/diheme cytochrome c family protein